MTIIAYRDGVMASDSLACEGDARVGMTRKVFRSPGGVLGGGCGEAGACAAFGEWVENSADGWTDHLSVVAFVSKYPMHQFSALVVLPNGHVYTLDAAGRTAAMDAEFFADGSGFRFALGAMAHGATAEEAVAVAIRLDTGCGGPIQVERLA